MSWWPIRSRSPAHRPERPLVAAVLTAGCLTVAGFQVALTLGAPLGAAALGGANDGQLPDGLRVVTALASVVWLFAAIVVSARGGLAPYPVSGSVSRVGTWVLVWLLGAGTLMNFASSSAWERLGWGPFTLGMFVLALVLARSGVASEPDRPVGGAGAQSVEPA
jgi:hypothetical protein